MEISGILTKQGQKMKTWRRRHFELHDNRLCYYLYDGGPMKGEFLIDENTTVQISNLKRHGFSLVQRNGKTLNMFADNAIDKERWMNTCLKIVNRLKSTKAVEKPLSTIFEMKDPVHKVQQDDYSQIFVHIIQANDLAPKGSTDTYAKVRVDAEYAATRIVKKELSPVWDEHFEFLWTSDLRFVRIEVWSDDPMHSSRDNFLGVVYIPILSLQPNSITSHWYKLGKRSARSNVSGEIKVSVSCNRAPDPYVLNVLRDIQKIPELQTKANDLLRFENFQSHGKKSPDDQPAEAPFDGEEFDLFPALMPPPETEFSEDLSLRVTFKPTLDKSTSASVEGILLLTNYRVIFVSHSRIAFAEESVADFQSNGMSEEFTCSIPLAMIVNLNLQAHYDTNSCQNEDAITITTNDSRVTNSLPSVTHSLSSQVFAFIFHGSRSQHVTHSNFNPEHANDVIGRRAISMESAPMNDNSRSALNSSESSRFLSLDRSFSSSSLTKGFLSRFRQEIRRNESFGDELGYLEGKSSVEGPPSQRIYARILWKVTNDLIPPVLLSFSPSVLLSYHAVLTHVSGPQVINRSVEIHYYQKMHCDLIRLINLQEDEIAMRANNSLMTVSSLGADESITFPTEFEEKKDEVNAVTKPSSAVLSNQSHSSLLTLPPRIRSLLSHNLSFGWNIYDPIAEFGRMGIPDALWRVTRINENYSICSTYPALLVVPEAIDDEQLSQASLFRSRGRFPALSWRHPHNFCSLTRCSQPLVGLGQNRSYYDELLLEAINQAGASPLGDDLINLSSTPSPESTSLLSKSKSTQLSTNHLGDVKRPLVIIDARPKINAQANQAAGKGYELGKGYENCRVLFMGIANIHVMRKSIDALEELCCKWPGGDDPSWHKNVESTGWLSHVSRVLLASVRIVHCIALEEYSVLVHCSDGWDRTAQLTSLPMLMMDPFYRTYQGFMILIEKEWFSFGHKFSDRLGWSEGGWHDEERSPVFHQFLDCVFQCLHQNPNIFEFNENLLLFLATHTLSGWFGNIFANSEKERLSSSSSSSHLPSCTLSLWTYLLAKRNEFFNPHYQLWPHVWIPNSQPRRVIIWKQWFLRWHHQIWELSWKKKNEDFSEISAAEALAPPRWMDDEAVKECCGCYRQFNFIRRRHHCRACGKIFCENCVRQLRIVLTISETTPVRCCNECVAIMDIQDTNTDHKAFSSNSSSSYSSFAKTASLVHKRVGRPSAFSIDSEQYSLPPGKRSSLKFPYSRPSISFDQYHPKHTAELVVSSSLTQEEELEQQQQQQGEGEEEDTYSEVCSEVTPNSSPQQSPRSQSHSPSSRSSSSPKASSALASSSFSRRKGTSFPFDQQSYDVTNPSLHHQPLPQDSMPSDDDSQSSSNSRRYSTKIPSSPTAASSSADRPRSTSYAPSNSSTTLALRTSMRYEKIKPNSNPLALNLASKSRTKKTDR
jgi:hypothetical protein